MSPEQKKQAIVGVILAAVVGGVLYQFVLKGGGSASSGAENRSASRSTATSLDLNKVKQDLDTLTNVDPLLSEIKVVNFIYENEKMERNPMAVVPLVIKNPTLDEPGTQLVQTELLRSVFEKRVTGILYNEARPMAIVDDELVTVGHMYATGVRIVQIDRDRVWFDVEDARVPLELKEL